MSEGALLSALLDLETRGWDSLCDGTGDRFYGDLMIDDAVMILAHGVVMDRTDVVASLADAPPWRTYEIREPRLVRIDTENAALVYAADAYRDGPEPAFTALMSSVYVRSHGEWRLALYQQTVMPQSS